jgi:hypothetical protein
MQLCLSLGRKARVEQKGKERPTASLSAEALTEKECALLRAHLSGIVCCESDLSCLVARQHAAHASEVR